jgi:uncharacterized membrane protein YqjE
MYMESERTDRGLGALVGRMADGFSRLVTQHLALARLELAEDARSAAVQLARLALFVPFVLTGYLLVCMALVLLLGRWRGVGGALALVGALNLGVGAVGIGRVAGRLRAHVPLSHTQQELGRSAAALVAAPGLAKEP